MASEKIQVDIASKYDDKGAKDAIRDVEKLEKSKPTIKVGADVKAAERDITGLLKKVDKLGQDPANLLLTSNATAIAREIAGLVMDLDKLDANDPTVDVKSAQINTLQGDLDQVVAKIKEVNGTDVDIDTSRAKQGLDDVGKSASSSKSVMANMVGNTTQDLGALGGVAGSAGVAIGQMGEYMVDAASDGDKMSKVLKNFAGIAVPIAAIGVAVQGIADARKRAEAAEKWQTDQIDGFVDALREGADMSDALAERLREVGKIEFQPGSLGRAVGNLDLSEGVARCGCQLRTLRSTR